MPRQCSGKGTGGHGLLLLPSPLARSSSPAPCASELLPAVSAEAATEGAVRVAPRRGRGTATAALDSARVPRRQCTAELMSGRVGTVRGKRSQRSSSRSRALPWLAEPTVEHVRSQGRRSLRQVSVAAAAGGASGPSKQKANRSKTGNFHLGLLALAPVSSRNGASCCVEAPSSHQHLGIGMQPRRRTTGHWGKLTRQGAPASHRTARLATRRWWRQMRACGAAAPGASNRRAWPTSDDRSRVRVRAGIHIYGHRREQHCRDKHHTNADGEDEDAAGPPDSGPASSRIPAMLHSPSVDLDLAAKHLQSTRTAAATTGRRGEPPDQLLELEETGTKAKRGEPELSSFIRAALHSTGRSNQQPPADAVARPHGQPKQTDPMGSVTCADGRSRRRDAAAFFALPTTGPSAERPSQ